MSTRCNIIIKDGKDRITLYHHHDGYPMGVGTELQQFLEKRYGGPYGHWYADSIANRLVKGEALYPFHTEDGKKDDEYEITFGLHGDIEYVYVINCVTKNLRCYEIPWDDEHHQDFRIRFDKVFRRRNLVHIPTLEERNSYVEDYNKRHNL